MKKSTRERGVVFESPWFQVVAEEALGGGPPHYIIQGLDFVVVVAVTPQGQILLVRQHRVAAGAATLELPAGHVDPGETPEQAARRELREETGYEAENFQLVGSLCPSVARFTNRMWCFYAPEAHPATGQGAEREAGVEMVLYDRGVRGLIEEKEFYSSPNYAALLLAMLRGGLKV